MKRILLLVMLCALGMLSVAQQTSAPKRGISVVSANDEQFSISIIFSDKSESIENGVSKWRFKKAKKGEQYTIQVELLNSKMVNNKASFELMMGKDPMELVVYANAEKDELRIMTRKSYDRMVNEAKERALFEQKRKEHMLQHQHPHVHEE